MAMHCTENREISGNDRADSCLEKGICKKRASGQRGAESDGSPDDKEEHCLSALRGEFKVFQVLSEAMSSDVSTFQSRSL